MKRDPIHPEVQQAFDHLRQVPPPDPQRQAARRTQFLGRAHRYRQSGGVIQPAARRPWWRALHPRRLALAGMLAVLVLALALGGGGLAYAADGAVPGEALYGLDRGLESLQLALTKQAGPKAQLWLSRAEERLQEAEELARRGDGQNLQTALQNYGTAVGSLAQGMGALSEGEAAGLAARVGESLAGQQARLGDVLGVQIRQRDRIQDPAAGEYPGACTGEQEHPVAASLAEEYGVSYEEIMTWFCEEGYGMGEIMLALETSQATGVPAAELLGQLAELGGWGLVWHSLGITGRPDPGPPEGAGAPAEAGPPEGAGPGEEAGPPEGAGAPGEAGPPAEAGPGEEVGPPEEAGPPDGSGPPEGAGEPEEQGPPEGSGPPDSGQSPEGSGPPDGAGPGGNGEPPEGSGPPDSSGSPGGGGKP